MATPKESPRPGRALRDMRRALERGGQAIQQGVREALRDRTGTRIGRDVGRYAREVARGEVQPQESGLSVRGITLTPEQRDQERRRRESRGPQGDMYKKGGVVKKPRKRQHK